MISSEKKVLIIAGMHRSGTSLITQWLYKCGLHVGDNLMEASFANVQGYFEDMDFVNAHVDILQGKKVKTCGMTVCNVDEIEEKNKEQLQDIILKKNKEHNEWGWKDPRTCLFLNTYASLIPDAYYLVIFRSFEETIHSLVTRDYKSSVKKFEHKKGISKWIWEHYKKSRRMDLFCRKYATHYLKVWIHYNNMLLQHLQTLPHSRYRVVHSSLLRENDVEVFSHLTNEWDFSLHYYPFNNIYSKALWNKQTDVLSYIKDKKLIDRAHQLQQQLQQYCNVKEFAPMNQLSHI